MPINLDTINQLYGTRLDVDGMRRVLRRRVAEPCAQVRTSEDVVVSQVGRELYEKFFRNYTRKQWGLDPVRARRAVTARVPVRDSTATAATSPTRYQAMPLHGYTRHVRAHARPPQHQGHAQHRLARGRRPDPVPRD